MQLGWAKDYTVTVRPYPDNDLADFMRAIDCDCGQDNPLRLNQIVEV